MLPEKFLQVLQTLKTGTEKGFLTWEDLPDEEMFRTSIAGGLVRIGKIKEEGKTGYTLTLTGHAGAIAAELEFWPGDNGYDLIADIYTSARLAARGGTQLLDMIINQGRAWK
jgi:hypothetical protein